MANVGATIRKFNRFELKYIITLKQAEAFKKSLLPFLIPDRYGNSSGKYTLLSLYYDSPKLHCYWEKEYGIKFRRKLRLRHYVTDEPFTDETPVFLEIKQRVDRVTQKRRAVLPYAEALRLANDRQMPNYQPEDKEVIEEIYAFIWQYNLIPMSIVRYDRQAFMGTEYDIGLRVTFDTDLAFQPYPLHLHEKPSGLPLIPPDRVVMEIKINERMPFWLTDLISAHNLQMDRISKYCCSIEAAQNMPLKWGVLPVAESASEVLASSLSVFNLEREKVPVPRKRSNPPE